MDFMTAAKTGFSKLGDMNGKAVRSEFWWYVLAVVLVMIVVNVVLVSVLGLLGSLIGQIVGIGLMIAATVRRLADAGKPAYWAYIYFGLALLVSLSQFLGPLAFLVTPLSLVVLVLLLVMIYFLVQPSA